MKICQWNLENFYLLMDKYNGKDLNSISDKEWSSYSLSTTQKNKDLFKIREIFSVFYF